MSINDVRAQWATYQIVVKAMYKGINDPLSLKNAIANLGRFPEDDPGEWSNWATGYDGLVTLENAVEVTNMALKAMVNFVSATNSIAAAVKLSAPTQQEVYNLVTQLNVANKAIQNDQRFAEALKIGKALAGNMSNNLSKP